MKTIVILSIFVSSFCLAQTKTSVTNGNFFALTTWDCFCLPSSGDTLLIQHEVTMNTSIAYTSGKITISGSGKLTDAGTDKDILIDGGSLYNYGVLECDGFLLESGYVYNAGNLFLDSLWTRDTMDNHGPLVTYDFLNDQNAKFVSIEPVTVNHNFANQGVFSLSGTEMSVINSFSNCNISSSNATLNIQNSILCIGNDFLNCGTDTVRGNGNIYIAGASTNSGEVEGSLTINTTSGGFSLNTGNIETSVVFGTANCNLGLSTKEVRSIIAYPNPTKGITTLNEQNFEFNLYDLSGKIIANGFSDDGNLDFSRFDSGVYLLEVRKNNTIQTLKISLK